MGTRKQRLCGFKQVKLNTCRKIEPRQSCSDFSKVISHMVEGSTRKKSSHLSAFSHNEQYHAQHFAKRGHRPHPLLLPSRLYCRFWNRTRSAVCLGKRVTDFAARIIVVRCITAGRELHPAPKECCFVNLDVSTLTVKNQSFFIPFCHILTFNKQ